MEQTMETVVMALAFALLLVSIAVREEAAMTSVKVTARIASGQSFDR
jgi:hypothetical protein